MGGGPGVLRVEGHDWAAWEDSETGVREAAGFVANPGMFCVHHAPLGPPIGGLLICSSIGAEMVRNYRREVLLARALSAQGIEVLRFHYRGTGNSEGDPAEVSVESMYRDGSEAVGLLAERVGSKHLAVLGTRWGGMVACELVKEISDAPLVLWEPVMSGREFFKDAFFARRIQGIRGSESGQREEASAEEELHRRGFIDVVGFVLHRRLYETASKMALVEIVDGPPRPALLVQLGHGQTLDGPYAALAEQLRQTGWQIEAHVVKEQESWWFETDRFRPEEDRLLTTMLLEHTGEWLLRTVRREQP